ncbi:undecaprenyl-diphosphate phosphatase [Candidatus Azambacteria bacterium]|nr:undecaprenyl-diphosphate phosphatase [Candidatus Azambacteria bacterium]
MLTTIQAAILGSLQGVSELFPVSSLGHSAILPALLGWNVNERNPFFLMFLVATHFATALVLFLFFWKDWMRIIGGIVRSLIQRKIAPDDTEARLGWLIIVATIPAGLIGLLFQDQIRSYFISAVSAAFFLALNGLMLYGAEQLRVQAPAKNMEGGDARIAALSWRQGLLVGALQALALIPGFSRTGASLAGGLVAGLSHEDAVRFSFLLATPIIGAAAALKLPALAAAGVSAFSISLVGALCAAFFAFLSVKFLTRYFKIEEHTLTPFAVYCVLAGVLSFVYLLLP